MYKGENMSDFIFGTATASFQIEGGVAEGGRTPSIWDTFCDLPGRVINADNGSIACDYFHKYKEDIELMHQLGVSSYRFSISWSRIFPAEGVYNPEGMEFYVNILKELKKYNISAMITLYHWDLPQWIDEKGGWLNRDTVNLFAEYAKKCFEVLDQDVSFWATLNEPFCSSFVSYLEGRHAPGHKNVSEAVKASHHLILAHGRAVQEYRKLQGKKQIGIVLNQTAIYPASNTVEDRQAANNRDGCLNRWFLDIVLKGKYPEDILNLYICQGLTDLSFMKEEDFGVMSEQLDFLGINFYSRATVEFDSTIISKGRNAYDTPYKKTFMDWDIGPEAFVEHIEFIRRSYTDIPIYITENGSCFDDIKENNQIHDKDRVEYLLEHLNAVEIMNQKGLNIKGYYCWSLLDNFEWAWGYSKRFGIIYVDYDTLERIPKDSFYAYQSYIREYKSKIGRQ